MCIFLSSLTEGIFLEGFQKSCHSFSSKNSSPTPGCFLKGVIRQNTSSQQKQNYGWRQQELHLSVACVSYSRCWKMWFFKWSFRLGFFFFFLVDVNENIKRDGNAYGVVIISKQIPYVFFRFYYFYCLYVSRRSKLQVIVRGDFRLSLSQLAYLTLPGALIIWPRPQRYIHVSQQKF